MVVSDPGPWSVGRDREGWTQTWRVDSHPPKLTDASCAPESKSRR